MLIKPLRFPRPEELVGIWHVAPGVKGISGNLNCSPGMYFTYREANQTFEQMGFWNNGGATVTGLAEPEQVRAAHLTYGTLQTLGVQPKLGQWFSLEDDTPGTPETVILSYGIGSAVLAGMPRRSAVP